MQNNLIEETAHSLKIALDQFDDLEENLDDFFGEDSHQPPQVPAVVQPVVTHAAVTNTLQQDTHTANTPKAKNATKHSIWECDKETASIIKAEAADIKRLFPTFIYTDSGEENEAIEAIRLAKPFNFRTPPKPSMKIHQRNGDLVLVPFDAIWWDGIDWFLTQLKWTPRRAENATMTDSTITFLELTIAFEILTGNSVRRRCKSSNACSSRTGRTLASAWDVRR